MLTGLYPFFGYSYDELRRNISDGSYQIPKDVEISVDCMDFMNCCLRFDCQERRELRELINHQFIADDELANLMHNDQQIVR